MPTLLLSRNYQPEANKLATIARQLRWNIQWLGRHGPTHLRGKDLALHAPTDVSLRVAQRHDIALLEPTLGILATLPECYTSRQIRFMRLGNAEVLDRPMFVRPADCTAKWFDAAVYESGRRILCDDDLSRSTPVLVAEPVEWENEYRTVVLERRVVTFSPYIPAAGWHATPKVNGRSPRTKPTPCFPSAMFCWQTDG